MTVCYYHSSQPTYYVLTDSSLVYKLLSGYKLSSDKSYIFLTDDLQVVLDYQAQSTLSSTQSVIIVKSNKCLDEISQRSLTSNASSSSVLTQEYKQNIHIYTMGKSKVYRIQGGALLSLISPQIVIFFA